MIIGTCGCCSTGSSAVSDYLKEFDNVKVLDNIEFTFVYLPDGLSDLYYHLVENICRDESSNVAITRFRQMMKSLKRYICRNNGISFKQYDLIVEDFLSSLVQMSFKAARRSDVWLDDSWIRRNIGSRIFQQRIIPFINKKIHGCCEIYPYRKIELSVNPENALGKFQGFVDSFIRASGGDSNDMIVLDQPFIGNDPVASFKFYKDAYAFVVDRDPRDNYIFAKEFLYKKGKFMPTNNVKEFVCYYRLMRDNMKYKQEHPRVMRLHFEDMVYDYDNTTEKIRRFLNLYENPNPKSIFDPNLSVNNTQLILRFPQYAEDVKYIEEQLPEYLYDFSRFPKPNNMGDMFMEKSPLNNK